jgi:hypothetical protein
MLRENYRKQFIACGVSELLAAGTDGDLVESIALATGKPFILDWIPALTAKVNFYWVKFYGVKGKKAWNPLYPVTLTTPVKQKEMSMIVDSGAEISLVSREIGDLLGFTVSLGEELETGVRYWVELRVERGGYHKLSCGDSQSLDRTSITRPHECA